MEQEILNLLRKNKIGHAKAHYLKHELLRLFGVSRAVCENCNGRGKLNMDNKINCIICSGTGQQTVC